MDLNTEQYLKKFKEISAKFVSTAICEFFDYEEDKIAAVQNVLDAAGFNAKATCWPLFGGIWLKKCEGKDGEEATKWLKNLTDTMKRGHFEDECAHVVSEISKRVWT